MHRNALQLTATRCNREVSKHLPTIAMRLVNLWSPQVCDMTHSYVWHDSFINVTWLIHKCDMTHSYVWQDSSIYPQSPCASSTSGVPRCVTWLIHMCDMTHLYVWHDSSINVTWLIHRCDMTHSYMWQDSFIYPQSPCALSTSGVLGCMAWLAHMCDMTHP